MNYEDKGGGIVRGRGQDPKVKIGLTRDNLKLLWPPTRQDPGQGIYLGHCSHS